MKLDPVAIERNVGNANTPEITRNQWLALKQAAEPYCECCGAGAGRVLAYERDLNALVVLGFALREVNCSDARITNAGRAFVAAQRSR